jgi:prolyl oligopeptidase
VCDVPLLDMIRYHKFRIAQLWVPEYGSAEDPEQFKYILKYSPYQNVKKGTAYPAVLFKAGDSDSRVDPLHARKMAALMQESTSADRPIFLRVEGKSGHGQGKPVSKVVEEVVEEWSFVFRALGLRVGS